MGLRGPKTTPTALRVAYSQPGAHAAREAPEAPPLTIAPEPPEWLTGWAVKTWERIVPLMMEIGMLSNADLDTLASFCECVRICYDNTKAMTGRRRKGGPPKGMIVFGPNGAPYINPLHTAKMQAMRDMSKYAQTLGLTPSARASISMGDRGGHGGAGTKAQKDAALAKKYGA